MLFTLLIIGFLAIGIAIGLLFRKKKIRGLSHTTMWLICLLLFMLGLEIGSNKEALAQLDNLGLTALILTLGSVGGSILMAWLLWKFMQRNKAGRGKCDQGKLDNHNQVEK